MTKKTRTVLFMIGATLLNIVLTAVLFVGFLALYSVTLGQILKTPSAGLAIGVSFMLAIIASSVIYKKILELLRKRIDFEATFGIKK
jgi:hypothetical protein